MPFSASSLLVMEKEYSTLFQECLYMQLVASLGLEGALGTNSGGLGSEE